MHGATCTPAGSSRPSTRSGAASLRGATVSTGRMRRVSLTTASIHASSPARTRAKTSGARARRSSAQASEPAVVSWPAASRVTRWSRSSASSSPAASSWREDVVAAGARRAAARDERHELLVDHGHASQERAPRAARPEVALGQRHRGGARQRARDGQRVADVGGQPLVARAEDGAQDHVERQLLHEAQRCDRASARPARQVLEGDLARHRPVGGDPIAVEGGEHEPPDAQVLGAVGEEDRARARPPGAAARGSRRAGRPTGRPRRPRARPRDARRAPAGRRRRPGGW